MGARGEQGSRKGSRLVGRKDDPPKLKKGKTYFTDGKKGKIFKSVEEVVPTLPEYGGLWKFLWRIFVENIGGPGDSRGG